MAKVNSVSVAADGAIWCITADGRLHQWAGNQWRADPGPAHPIVEVSVASRLQAYCRDSQGNVFVKTDAPPHVPAGWLDDNRVHDPFGRGIRAIAATSDGMIWVVTRQGVPTFNAMGGNPVPHASDAIDISAGNHDHAVYINDDRLLMLLQRNGVQAAWVRIASPVEPSNELEVRIQSVGLGADGVMWATDTRDFIYRRNPTGSWRRNDKLKAKQIAVGSKDHVYCVNDAGELFRAENGNDGMTGWQRIVRPGTAMHTVTVQPGDSLSGIISRLCDGLTHDQLMAKVREVAALNNLPNPDLIHPGNTLLIPAC